MASVGLAAMPAPFAFLGTRSALRLAEASPWRYDGAMYRPTLPPLSRSLALAALMLAVPVSAQTLLIGNKGEDTVSVLDLASGAERARMPTGKAPHEIAVSPDGKFAAVVAYGGTSIDLFDIRKRALVRRIEIAPNAGPHGIVWFAPGRIALVADRSGTLALIDPRKGTVETISTGQKGSHMLVLSPDKRLAYVSNILSGTISVIDLRARAKLADIAVGGAPEGLAITPDGKQLWVGDDSGPRLKVVDLASRTVIATLPTDPIAIRVAISPDGKTAITSNYMAGTLSLFDVASRRPLRTIRVSGEKAAFQVTIAFSRNARLLYVAETGRDTIAEVDLASGQVLRRLKAGKSGDGLAIAP